MEVLIFLIGSLIVVFPCWKIAERGGKSGALSLLIFIPAVGVLVYWIILASSDWGYREEQR